VTVTVRLLVKAVIVHTAVPFPLSQPTKLAVVAGAVGVALMVMGVPAGKKLLQLLAQPRPAGLLDVVPVPTMSSVRRKSVPELPGHTTFAVIEPVIMAPDEERPPALPFV
jgi:hypothetical protein